MITNMKKSHILLLASLVWGTAWAEEDNSLYFTDAAVKPGETANIELCMRNLATDLTCIEAEIQLPEGLSVVCDEEGNPVQKPLEPAEPEEASQQPTDAPTGDPNKNED